MADITKCTNEACIIRKGCYRWTALADPIWQAYSRFEPFHNGDYYTCDYYIPDHKAPVHESAPFIISEQPQKVNTTPSNSRELE
jgi:hypothetical protein